MHTTTHNPAVHEKTSDTGAANSATQMHVRWYHTRLAEKLVAEPDIHDPSRPVGSLDRFSQTYPSDCHDADHEFGFGAADPEWLRAMRIDTARTCDVCGRPDGRYSSGRPGHFTACRWCTLAGVCLTCGEALVHGICPENHPQREMAAYPAYRSEQAQIDRKPS